MIEDINHLLNNGKNNNKIFKNKKKIFKRVSYHKFLIFLISYNFLS